MNETLHTQADAFPSTRWSHVLMARQDHSRAHTALNELCLKYWRPVFEFARHRGLSPHDAEDLTQAYFADLLARGYLHHADQARGRFRAFLIHDLKYFMSNQAGKANAQKRGGGARLIPIDLLSLESHRTLSASDEHDPDAQFDRQWALETVRQARQHVREEYTSQQKHALFAALQSGLIHPTTPALYEQWQRELGMTHDALKVALHRLRERFRTALEEQVLETVTSPAELEAEMQYLREVLSRAPSES